MALPFKNIVIIGAGNVAYHFALALKEAGKNILQIYSRTEESAKELATIVGASFTNNVKEINPTADIYIIAVSDSAIAEIVQTLLLPNSIVVHVAGSVPMDILKPVSENIGVLYPLQSLSKNVDRDFSEIPLCVEASNDDTFIILGHLAKELSKNVTFLNSNQRKIVHLAAVFASNFGNCLNVIVSEMLSNNNIPLHIFKPLVMETAKKFGVENIKELQTGPAIRKDQKVIDAHIDMLDEKPDYQNLYKLFTKIIQEEIADN